MPFLRRIWCLVKARSSGVGVSRPYCYLEKAIGFETFHLKTTFRTCQFPTSFRTRFLGAQQWQVFENQIHHSVFVYTTFLLYSQLGLGYNMVVKRSYSFFHRDIATILSSPTVLTVPKKYGNLFKATWMCFLKGNCQKIPGNGSAVHR